MIDLREHTLDNGLRVVLAPDRSTPVVAVNLWYRVGSRNEPSGKTGFAHLFEHMMFQGSAHVEKNGHFEHIESVGGTLNATTWFDRTNYFETVPSHHLDLALWLESDRMGWMLPAMTAEKLENQRQVVMNERRQRYDNQPYGDWDERVQGLLFPPEHPYHHTVIGAMEDIEAATLEDVHDFFGTYYLPNNAVLTICGDFQISDALEGVERYFGPIPIGPSPPDIPGSAQLVGPVGGTRREDVVSKVPLPKVYVACRVPPFTSEAFYAGEVVAGCLGAGRASRLYDRLVRAEGIAKAASSHLLPLTTGATMCLTVATGMPSGDVDGLEEAVLGELDDLGSLAQEEVSRAVEMSETRTLRELERVGSRADMLSMYASSFGDPDRLNQDLRRLRKVTLDQAREWATGQLGGDNRVVVRYIPEGS